MAKGECIAPEHSKVWHLDYRLRGKRYRESAHTTVRGEALDTLRQRVGDRRSGKLTGSPERIAVHDLRVLTEQAYDLKGNRSKRRLQQAWAHLEGFLGAETKVPEVTALRIDDYAAHRLHERAARSTVNTELAALRRGFRLARKKGLLAVIPEFEIPEPDNARQGFCSEGDIAALMLDDKLPPVVRDVVQFLWATGWRLGEALNLTWANVDRETETIRLSASETKGKKGRVFPYGAAPGLKGLLDARYEVRDGLFVFHRSGKRVRSIRKGWGSACRRAGLTGRLVHDLRRSAAREFRRSGLSESDVMELAGWKTAAMFRRYAITDEQHLEAQVAKRLGSLGTVWAQSAGAAAEEAR